MGSPRRVRLVVEDTGTDPAAALERLRGMAARGIRIVVGPQTSAEVAAVKAYADQNGILVLSQGSTARSLSLPGDNVYRFAQDDTFEAQAVTALLAHDGIRAVVPVWRGDAGNDGLAASVRDSFQALGGSVADGARYSPTATDFAAVVDTVGQQARRAIDEYGAAAVGIYLAAFDEVVPLFHQAARDPVLASLRWYGSDGVALSEGLARDAPAARFAAGAGYPNPIFGLPEETRATWEPIVQRVSATIGRIPESFAISAYDALWLATRAHLEAGDLESPAVLKAALERAAESYSGATGSTAFDEAGDRKVGSYDFWAVRERDGAFRWARIAQYDGATGAITRLD
jgi:branched-chain amino acid transport system substrate-binding protein